MVRSARSDAAIALTSAIGLRRDPQPPIPMVIPDRSSPTTSAVVMTLGPLPPVNERLPGPVGDSGQVKLKGEPLLVPVGPAHVYWLDAVQRLLGQPDDLRVLRRDLHRDRVSRRPELRRRHDIEHCAVAPQRNRRN